MLLSYCYIYLQFKEYGFVTAEVTLYINNMPFVKKLNIFLTHISVIVVETGEVQRVLYTWHLRGIVAGMTLSSTSVFHYISLTHNIYQALWIALLLYQQLPLIIFIQKKKLYCPLPSARDRKEYHAGCQVMVASIGIGSQPLIIAHFLTPFAYYTLCRNHFCAYILQIEDPIF